MTTLQAVQATPGVLVVDSLPYSMGGTPKIAAALKAEGVACVVGYLGAMNAARVAYLADAGIAFMPVTFGTTVEHFNGAASVAQAKALGYPEGGHVFLDVEGMAIFHTDPATLIAAINAWGQAVQDAGYKDGLYVGVPQPLDSAELYGLHESLYWHGQGQVRDRLNRFADPECGWCIRQKYPSLIRGGILVDDNTIEADKLGRLPFWAEAADDMPDVIHPEELPTA